jgi:hypothetical protein
MSQDSQGTNQVPISKELCEAFWGAIRAYKSWVAGESMREVPYNGRLIDVALICMLVRKHEAPMPDDLWRLLAWEEPPSRTLPSERSYRAGAEHLERLIKDRKAHFDRETPPLGYLNREAAHSAL